VPVEDLDSPNGDGRCCRGGVAGDVAGERSAAERRGRSRGWWCKSGWRGRSHIRRWSLRTIGGRSY